MKQNPIKALGSRGFHFKLLCVLTLFHCHIDWEPGGRVNLASPEGASAVVALCVLDGRWSPTDTSRVYQMHQ